VTHFNTTHGDSRRGLRTKEYKTWVRIKRRCFVPECPGYERYGGRGITMCERWRDSYEAFLEDIGRSPQGSYSIDRIDNNGNYEPGNCRWATSREQASNRCTTRLVEAFGRSMCITAWSRETGLSAQVITWRLARGMGAEEALSKPVPGRRAPVTSDIAKQVIARIACGESHKAISAALGVSRTTISYIRNGRIRRFAEESPC
jgi:hypothetical protein